MNITATLIGQILTFAALVWFVQRFLWGPLTQLMKDREKRISEGLAAGERGKKDLELAKERASEVIHEAKEQAAAIINKAEKRGSEIVEEAKQTAREEGARLLVAAQAEIEQEANQAKEALRGQVVQFAISGAEKVLEREVDAKTHSEMLDKLVAQI